MDKITIASNMKQFGDYFESIPKVIRIEFETKGQDVRQTTKRIVRDHLTQGNGVRMGIYKKSISIKNLSQTPDHIHYHVYANKKHYRLTHLLEHGHKIKGFYERLTKKTKTKAIPHIKYGQDYADREVVKLIENAIDKALERKIQ